MFGQFWRHERAIWYRVGARIGHAVDLEQLPGIPVKAKTENGTILRGRRTVRAWWTRVTFPRGSTWWQCCALLGGRVSLTFGVWRFPASLEHQAQRSQDTAEQYREFLRMGPLRYRRRFGFAFHISAFFVPSLLRLLKVHK